MAVKMMSVAATKTYPACTKFSPVLRGFICVGWSPFRRAGMSAYGQPCAVIPTCENQSINQSIRAVGDTCGSVVSELSGRLADSSGDGQVFKWWRSCVVRLCRSSLNHCVCFWGGARHLAQKLCDRWYCILLVIQGQVDCMFAGCCDWFQLSCDAERLQDQVVCVVDLCG